MAREHSPRPGAGADCGGTRYMARWPPARGSPAARKSWSWVSANRPTRAAGGRELQRDAPFGAVPVWARR